MLLCIKDFYLPPNLLCNQKCPICQQLFLNFNLNPKFYILGKKININEESMKIPRFKSIYSQLNIIFYWLRLHESFNLFRIGRDSIEESGSEEGAYTTPRSRRESRVTGGGREDDESSTGDGSGQPMHYMSGALGLVPHNQQ